MKEKIKKISEGRFYKNISHKNKISDTIIHLLVFNGTKIGAIYLLNQML